MLILPFPDFATAMALNVILGRMATSKDLNMAEETITSHVIATRALL
jgi:hypothetical protein